MSPGDIVITDKLAWIGSPLTLDSGASTGKWVNVNSIFLIVERDNTIVLALDEHGQFCALSIYVVTPIKPCSAGMLCLMRKGNMS